jgi:8-oxo-dGTP diphosphatase
MTRAVPEFGERIEGQFYRSRPGAYALITDSTRRLCIIQSNGGHFLPGGAIEPGETAENALVRELREELGRTVCILGRIGEAVQYVFAQGEAYFAIRGIFFRARLDEKKGEPTEPDSEVLWLPTSLALERLTRRSDAWAVAQMGSPDAAST